jgi:hypothetical protein
LHSIFKLQPRSRNIPTGFSLRRVPDLVPHQEELNVSWSNAKLLGSPVELPKRHSRPPLRSPFGIVVARNVAEAQKHVRKSVLVIYEQIVLRRKTWTHNSIQLIIDIRLICCVAAPCMVPSPVLAVCVALLGLVLERAVPDPGRQCIWIPILPGEGAAWFPGSF